MNFIVAIALTLLMLYGWAAICFLCFRFHRRETEETQRHFLEVHRDFFTRRIIRKARTKVTRQTMRWSGASGLLMAGLPVMNMSHQLSLITVLLSMALLFFGGLVVAYSWYGLRCLRMLGLDVWSSRHMTSVMHAS
jgi:hypothetical protein